jgi:hypothetical protein
MRGEIREFYFLRYEFNLITKIIKGLYLKVQKLDI